jgi:hypothetical protein
MARPLGVNPIASRLRAIPTIAQLLMPKPVIQATPATDPGFSHRALEGEDRVARVAPIPTIADLQAASKIRGGRVSSGQRLAEGLVRAETPEGKAEIARAQAAAIAGETDAARRVEAMPTGFRRGLLTEGPGPGFVGRIERIREGAQYAEDIGALPALPSPGIIPRIGEFAGRAVGGLLSPLGIASIGLTGGFGGVIAKRLTARVGARVATTIGNAVAAIPEGMAYNVALQLGRDPERYARVNAERGPQAAAQIVALDAGVGGAQFAAGAGALTGLFQGVGATREAVRVLREVSDVLRPQGSQVGVDAAGDLARAGLPDRTAVRQVARRAVTRQVDAVIQRGKEARIEAPAPQPRRAERPRLLKAAPPETPPPVVAVTQAPVREAVSTPAQRRAQLAQAVEAAKEQVSRKRRQGEAVLLGETPPTVPKKLIVPGAAPEGAPKKLIVPESAGPPRRAPEPATSAPSRPGAPGRPVTEPVAPAGPPPAVVDAPTSATPTAAPHPAIDRMRQTQRAQSAKALQADAVQTPIETRTTVRKGARTSVSAPRGGTRVDAEWAVMNINAVTSSHFDDFTVNPVYPRGMQPRDRSRGPYRTQIREIIGNLDPEELGESSNIAFGAPTIGRDGIIESGNGRVLVLRTAYREGAEGAARYRAWLRANASKFGLKPEDVDAVGDQPGLFRIRRGAVPDRVKWAADANVSGVAQMGAREVAQQDAERIESFLHLYEPGDLTSAANRPFVRRFFEGIPSSEANQLLGDAGELAPAGLARVRTALVARAFGDQDARVITRIAESLDDDVKNMSNALMVVAPRWAKIRSQIAAGDLHDLDVSKPLVEAIEALSRGRVPGQTVMLDEAQISDEAQALLGPLHDFRRSGKRLVDFLNHYLDDVERAGNPKQEDLLGGAPPQDRLKLIEGAAARVREGAPLTGEPASRPVAAPSPQVDTRPPGRGTPAAQTPSEIARELEKLRAEQPRPLAKLHGPNPTPEQASAHARAMLDWQRRYSALNKQLRAAQAADQATDPVEQFLALPKDRQHALTRAIDTARAELGGTQQGGSRSATRIATKALAIYKRDEPTATAPSLDWLRRYVTAQGSDESATPGRVIAPGATKTAPLPVAHRPGAAAPTPPQSLDDIVKRLDRAIIPLRIGRMGRIKAGTQGIYKVHPEVARSRHALDVPTLAHEIGHHLDKHFGLQKSPYLDEATQFLMINQSAYTKRQLQGEKVAEFVRTYLEDPALAKRLAPNLTSEFEATVGAGRPEWLGAIQDASRRLQEWRRQPDVDKIATQLQFTDPDTPAALTGWAAFYKKFVERMQPIDDAARAMAGGRKLTATEDPMAWAIRSRGWAGRADVWMKWGPVDEFGNPKAGGVRGVEQILKDVRGDEKHFFAYLVARHAQTWQHRGLETGLDLRAVTNTVASASPAVRKAADEWVKFNDAVMQELVDGGILKAETAARYRKRYPFYVSMARQGFEGPGGGPPGQGQGFTDLASPVKTAHGSTRPIVHPLESTIRRTYAAISLTSRNRVGQAFYDLARATPGGGRAFELVPTPVRPAHLRLSQIARAIEDAGGDLSTADLAARISVFRPTGRGVPKDNVVGVWINGVQRYAKVDPELYRTLNALNVDTAGYLAKLARPWTAILRAGAILSPDFLFRNLVRDQVMAFINSEYGYLPVVDFIRGAYHVIGRTDTYKRFLASGAGQSTMVGLDRKTLGDTMLRMMRQEAGIKKWMRYSTTPIEALRWMSDTVEMSTRLGEFSKGIAKGGTGNESVARAALAARGITLDYSRFGDVGQSINSTVAFWNPWIQGLDRMRLGFRDHPVRFTAKALTAITAPTVVLYALNRDDPEWRAAPRWKKDTAWFIRLTPNSPGLWVAKPFELGTVFGSSVERALEWLDTEDPEAFAEFGKTLRSQILDPSLPIPTAIMPIFEAWANFNFFTGRPIVPESEKGLPEGLQAGPYTSTVAKRIGPALGVSPRKIEHLITGYTAGLGQYALAAPEAVGVLPQRPGHTVRTRLESTPGVKGLTMAPFAQSQDVEEFYRRYARAEQAVNAEKLARGARGRVTVWTPAVREFRRLAAVRDDFSDMRRQIRRTLAREDISREQKRFLVDGYNRRMVDRARRALKKPALSVPPRGIERALGR